MGAPRREATYNLSLVMEAFALGPNQISSYLDTGSFRSRPREQGGFHRSLTNIDLLKIAALKHFAAYGMLSADLQILTKHIESMTEDFYGDRRAFLNPCFFADGQMYILTLSERGAEGGPRRGYIRGYWLGSLEHLFTIVREAIRKIYADAPGAYQCFLRDFDGAEVQSGVDF